MEWRILCVIRRCGPTHYSGAVPVERLWGGSGARGASLWTMRTSGSQCKLLRYSMPAVMVACETMTKAGTRASMSTASIGVGPT